MDNVAARGTWGRVEWAIAANGQMPASAFLNSDEVNRKEKPKCWALINRLAEIGHRLAFQPEKFKKLGDKAKGRAKDLLELRPTAQIRFLGIFLPDQCFLIAVGLRKKQDDLRSEDMERALKIIDEHNSRHRGK